MKKVSAALFLTAALSLGASAYAQTTNPTGQIDNPGGQTGLQKPEELKDIPAGHWASEAIKVVSSCGIIRGYPDGTFRGNRPITRYEAAAMVARLIEAIRTGQCGLGNGPGQINNEQLVVLQNAIQELAADLAQLGVRVAELEDNAVTQDDLARVEEIASQARDLAEAAAGNAGGEDGDALQIAQDALALAEAAQPAGDYATQDDLAAVAETAQEALDAIETLTGIDPEALAELGAQIEAASIAADTALAQSRELQDKVDELGGRVDDLAAELGEIGATVEGQAESITALNDLVVLLNQDVLALQDRVGNLERQVEELTAAVQDGSGDFATQDDLEEVRADATGLRRDQTALSERVGALEDRVTAVEGRVTTLEGRVTALESNAFTVSGTLSLSYNRSNTWTTNGGGPNVAASDFDVNRLGIPGYGGTGSPVARTPATGFTDFRRGYPTTLGPRSIALVGFTGARDEGYTAASLSLDFTFRPRSFLGGGGQAFPFTIVLSLGDGGGFNVSKDNYSGLNVVNDIQLNLKTIQTNFLVGAAPLTINFGVAPAFAFNNYAFNNTSGRGDGFVATLDMGPLLPFNPTLSIVYGSKGKGVFNSASFGTALVIYNGSASTPAPTAAISRLVYSGSTGDTRLEVNLSTSTTHWKVFVTYADGTVKDQTVASGFNVLYYDGPSGSSITSVTAAPLITGNTAGVPFDGTIAGGLDGDNTYFTGFRGTLSLIPGLKGGIYYANEGQDIRSAQAPTTLYGLDFKGQLFGLLSLDGEYNVSVPTGSVAGVAGYVKAGINLDPFTISGNWRSVDGWYNPLGDDGSYPYALNQVGFGADIGIKKLLGFLDFAAYYDTRSSKNGDKVGNGPKSGTDTTAANETDFGVSLGFRLIGFDLSFGVTRENEHNGNPQTQATRDRTGISATAAHDGSKAGALIGGFNLAGGYIMTTDGLNLNSNERKLYVYADTSVNLAGFTVAPKAYFSSIDQNGAIGTDDVTNYGAAINITGDFLFNSKISLGAAFDQSNHSVQNYTASTGWVMVALNWAQGPFPNSSFSVGYASRTDIRRDGTGFGPSFGSPIGSGAWGSDNSALGYNESGIYATFGYYGLSFRYGIFALTDFSGASSIVTWGSRFQIGYALKF
jgi:predicted  nucleic acid-binding Zn-ribbon protein